MTKTKRLSNINLFYNLIGRNANPKINKPIINSKIFIFVLYNKILKNQ